MYAKKWHPSFKLRIGSVRSIKIFYIEDYFVDQLRT